MKKKKTFAGYLKQEHNLTWFEYLKLNEFKQCSLKLKYLERS